MYIVERSAETIIGKNPCVSIDDLRKKFPKIFSQQPSISIREGWVPLVERLCYMIQSNHDYNQHMGYTQVVAIEVKPKFAGLSFYFSNDKQVHPNENTKWSDWFSYVSGAVDFANAMSHVTCEWCGSPGITRNIHGYYYTSCDTHVRVD